MNIAQSQIDEIKSYLSDKISPFLIILFGSATKGTMTDSSDIDIAFLSDENFDPYNLFMTAQELADKLGRNVDLVDLETASTVFRVQILSRGKAILDNHPSRRKLFQMNSFKDYATLNEERQCILDKLSKSSTVTKQEAF